MSQTFFGPLKPRAIRPARGMIDLVKAFRSSSLRQNLVVLSHRVDVCRGGRKNLGVGAPPLDVRGHGGP